MEYLLSIPARVVRAAFGRVSEDGNVGNEVVNKRDSTNAGEESNPLPEGRVGEAGNEIGSESAGDLGRDGLDNLFNYNQDDDGLSEANSQDGMSVRAGNFNQSFDNHMGSNVNTRRRRPKGHGLSDVLGY